MSNPMIEANKMRDRFGKVQARAAYGSMEAFTLKGRLQCLRKRTDGSWKDSTNTSASLIGASHSRRESKLISRC